MNTDSCCVCFEECVFFTECDHCLCVNCYNSMNEDYNFQAQKFVKNCPICRRIMETEPAKQKTLEELRAELRKYKDTKNENEKLKKENEKLKEINTNFGNIIDVKNTEIKQLMDINKNLEKTIYNKKEEIKSLFLQLTAQTPAQTPAQQNINATFSKKKPAGKNAGIPANVLLGDLPFNSRPRHKCTVNGCQRDTRRVCPKCRAVRVCQEHNECGC